MPGPSWSALRSRVRLRTRLRALLARLTPEPPLPPPDPRQLDPALAAAWVAQHYDQYSPDYAATYGAILQAHRPADVDELLAHELESLRLDDGMRVLDAGCGFCGPAIWFAQRKRVEIDGVTLSSAMAATARAAVGDAGLAERIRVTEGDFQNLPALFAPETFDRAMFLESVGYAPRLPELLDGVRIVLKPGGCIYVKDWCQAPFPIGSVEHRRAQIVFGKIFEQYGYQLTRREAMLDALAKSGFEIEMERVLSLPFDPAVMVSFDQRVGFDWFSYMQDFTAVVPMEFLARRQT